MDQQATILWIVHRCHRQLYHRKNGLKYCAEFAQNSQKWRTEFANHARRICNFLAQNSDVPICTLLKWQESGKNEGMFFRLSGQNFTKLETSLFYNFKKLPHFCTNSTDRRSAAKNGLKCVVFPQNLIGDVNLKKLSYPVYEVGCHIHAACCLFVICLCHVINSVQKLDSADIHWLHV